MIENSRPRPLAANVNAGIGATSGAYVLFSNPDAVPDDGAVAELVAFMDAHPRCGIAGPRIRWPDGTWQPSRRRFPTVSGTIVRRTPLRRLSPPYENQREHYLLDEVTTEPVEADWMLGAFLLQRRTMLEEIGGWDAGYRHYVEDIDLCYRAMRAGWERWYVPSATVTPRLRGGDRQEVPLPPHPLAPARAWPGSRASTPRRSSAAAADQLGAGSNVMPSWAPK